MVVVIYMQHHILWLKLIRYKLFYLIPLWHQLKYRLTLGKARVEPSLFFGPLYNLAFSLIIMHVSKESLKIPAFSNAEKKLYVT